VSKENAPLSGGFVIEVADNEFILVGVNCRFDFVSKSNEPVITAYLQKREGVFENGVWKAGRILNGDEGYVASFGDMMGINWVMLVDVK
jgi:hypothetical protein